MGVDNVIEAYHIVTRYLLVVSFTHHAHDSYHICPNSFRIGIHQLTLTLKMFECRYHECISSFTIKSGAVHITYPVSMVSFFLPYLPQCKQCGNIYNSIAALQFPWPLSNGCISSYWNLHASLKCVLQKLYEVCC